MWIGIATNGMSSDELEAQYGPLTVDSINALAADGVIDSTSTSDPVVDSVDGTATATSTPNGYRLLNPGIRRSDYIYDSDWMFHLLYWCTTTCTLKAETEVQLHEYVTGGSSHTWVLTSNARTVRNPGGITWSYHKRYWCGVNITGASDPICTNGASPSGIDTVFNPGDSQTYYWGATNSITVFPMMGESTHFSVGITLVSHFRGYDTLSRSSTTRLNTSSGSGG